MPPTTRRPRPGERAARQIHGIVYATDAKSGKVVVVGTSRRAGSHPAIIYPVASEDSTNADAAAYLDFLKSAEAAEIFADEGLTPLAK